ncbi:nitroreductase family protein [Breznakiellaceae bacterium SP9]
MKKIGCGIAAVVLLAGMVSAIGAQDKTAFSTIVNHYAARNFVEGQVTRAQIDKIIEAGRHAPSANNRQPWLFTVVQSKNVANNIVPSMPDGNILIVVSARGDGRTNGSEILDCGLAAQSIYLEAQGLGLGSRIYTGPISNVNAKYKNALGLPADYNAIVLIRVGKVDAGIDAISAASARKPLDSVVTFK